MIKKTALFLSVILLLSNSAFAGENNNLRTMFLNNKARICGINLRTFNAKDINGNKIIEENEDRGNFINAIERLDEIKSLGFNTLHLLPITPNGKLKALGTAGSLYAISSFSDINPQITDKHSDLSPKEQAKKFIEECHKRNIRVIVDLPSCGSYDLFLTNPELYIKDERMCSVVPSDWTDVRLLNAGKNGNLNKDVMDAHKRFIDMIFEIGADGIRADVATIKPTDFWKELISYTRAKDSDFMFLAEASDSWREPPSQYAEFTPYNELLEAGFDGYYGSFFNLKDWKGEDLIEHLKFNQKLFASYTEPKSVITSFTTHDEISPVIMHGENFSVMIAWLQAVLPYNTYCIDGFFNGDMYLYPWINSKADKTETDDDTYFMHRGKLDIFNFSAKPDGKNEYILTNFKKAYDFRINNEDIVINGSLIPLKTKDENIFAIKRTYNNDTIIIIGNLDFKTDKEHVVIKGSKTKKHKTYENIHNAENITVKRNSLTLNIKAGEIKILRFKN